jgi:adhesin/invasin
VFGQNLNAANAVPGSLPLPSSLGDVEVRLNDQPIPLLFAGPGQVNAQIPYTLSADTEYQLEVRRGSALTTPQPVVIAQARPGIFTVDQSGQGQGHIYRALTDGSQRLADAAGAATAGEVLVIYCNGLGMTTPAVVAGAAAPFSPLAVTANPVTLTIGGQNAAIAFAGLAPGFTGLYQVNAVVPGGVAAGGTVPVVLSVAGQASVAVNMGIR